MVAVPVVASVVTMPPGFETVAVGSDDIQVVDRLLVRSCVAPFASVPVAVN